LDVFVCPFVEGRVGLQGSEIFIGRSRDPQLFYLESISRSNKFLAADAL